ncbi:MAG: Ig-like domain-containing protein, partial [Marinicellaceae bacterium]
MLSTKNKFKHKTSMLYIALLLLFCNHLNAATQEQKLIASDAAMVDFFGKSVSISGDYAVIGAYQAEIDGDRSGAAYVFKYDGSQWQEVVKLSPQEAFENYGLSVSISGDTIAIGAPHAVADNQNLPGNEPQAGVVYIFKKDVNNNWNETHRLFPADVDGYDKFGSSVSLENNQLIVGSPFDDDSATTSGSAYIFDYNGSDWIESVKLTASNPIASDKFGFKVDINGNRAIISSPNVDDAIAGDNVGAVYVFEKGVTGWNETKILQASDMADSDFFGIDISLSGDRILVGASKNDDTAQNSGSAYIFGYNNTSMLWDSGLKINANDASANDGFGISVKIDGDNILIGADSNDDGELNSGSVYRYIFNGNDWQFNELILHTDSPTRFTDAFGSAIDIDNGKALIGSYLDDGSEGQTFNSGAAYIFEVDAAPVAIMDNVSINEDAINTNIDVLVNDTDNDGGVIIITELTQPLNGTSELVSGGTSLNYQPNSNYCNDEMPTDDFTYTLNGGSTTTVSVTVNCIDDFPVAKGDAWEILEDSDTVTLQVIDNDTDIDDGPLFIDSFTQPANGTVTAFGEHLNYKPNPNYCSESGEPEFFASRGETNTSDVFTYTLNGGSSALVNIFVNCINDAPVAVLDSVTLNEDQGTTVLSVLENDTDVDDGEMFITEFSKPNNGEVLMNNNTISYKPDLNYCNDGMPTDDFTYTLNGGSTTTVLVTVNCIDDLPVAKGDALEILEDSDVITLQVIDNDTDIDDGPLFIDSFTQP